MARQLAPTRATRRGRKARIALSGTAGSGKTWTALETATILATGDEKIVVVDTERGSAALYADAFEFDHVDWEPPYDPRELGEAVRTLASDYGVVIIDSLSHFWEGEGGTMDIVDAAAARSRGNSFAGWKEGTPAQQKLIDGLLATDAHVIATMRSKTEYVLEQTSNGKTAPRKVGMAPVQRHGLEYEFTVVGYIDADHRLTVEKTRCHDLTDQSFPVGRTGEFGETLGSWLSEAEPVPPPPEYAAEEDVQVMRDRAATLDGAGKDAVHAEMEALSVSNRRLTRGEVTHEELTALEAVVEVELERQADSDAEPIEVAPTGEVAGFMSAAKGLDPDGKTALKQAMAGLGVSSQALTKHRVTPDQLAALHEVLAAELDRMGEPFPLEETA